MAQRALPHFSQCLSEAQDAPPDISKKKMPPIYKRKCRLDAAGGEMQREGLMDRYFPFYTIAAIVCVMFKCV